MIPRPVPPRPIKEDYTDSPLGDYNTKNRYYYSGKGIGSTLYNGNKIVLSQVGQEVLKELRTRGFEDVIGDRLQDLLNAKNENMANPKIPRSYTPPPPPPPRKVGNKGFFKDGGFAEEIIPMVKEMSDPYSDFRPKVVTTNDPIRKFMEWKDSIGIEYDESHDESTMIGYEVKAKSDPRLKWYLMWIVMIASMIYIFINQ